MQSLNNKRLSKIKQNNLIKSIIFKCYTIKTTEIKNIKDLFHNVTSYH